MAEPQRTVEIDINTLAQVAMLTQPRIAVLNLSIDLSVNLSHVMAYEAREIVGKVDVLKGSKTVTEEQGTGEFVPCLILTGGEVVQMTPEQNAVFRDAWKAFNTISTYSFSAVKSLAAAIAGVPVPAGDVAATSEVIQ